jgi:hypothetical protein
MPCLGLRHTGATERWIYISSIGGKTVADAAAIATMPSAFNSAVNIVTSYTTILL